MCMFEFSWFFILLIILIVVIVFIIYKRGNQIGETIKTFAGGAAKKIKDALTSKKSSSDDASKSRPPLTLKLDPKWIKALQDGTKKVDIRFYSPKSHDQLNVGSHILYFSDNNENVLTVLKNKTGPLPLDKLIGEVGVDKIFPGEKMTIEQAVETIKAYYTKRTEATTGETYMAFTLEPCKCGK